jgi:hypothetical protein
MFFAPGGMTGFLERMGSLFPMILLVPDNAIEAIAAPDDNRNVRLLLLTLCSMGSVCTFLYRISYLMPFFLQAERQLKQLTQRESSTFMVSLSIHCDLHCFSQAPQRVHVDSEIVIWKIEIFESKPREVPTGQMVLQYDRPLNHDIWVTNKKKRIAIPKASGTKLTCSTL